MIGVNVTYGGLTPSELKQVYDKEILNWRSFADPKNAIAAKWNLSGTPTYYIIDDKGVIRHKWVGPPVEKAIDVTLEKLIKEAEAAAKKTTK